MIWYLFSGGFVGLIPLILQLLMGSSIKALDRKVYDTSMRYAILEDSTAPTGCGYCGRDQRSDATAPTCYGCGATRD